MALLKKPSPPKNTKDRLQAAIEKNPCADCRQKRLPFCQGHSKGAGLSDNNSNDQEDQEDLDLDPSSYALMILSDLLFDLDSLGDALLMIPDPSRGIFSIYLKPSAPEAEETQVRGLMRMIRMEFNEFKAALKHQGVLVDQFACNNDPNELMIRFPSPKFYDGFIQRLLDKKLLSQSYLDQLQQTEKPRPRQISHTPSMQGTYSSQNDEARDFNPSPLRTSLELKYEPWK